MNSKNSIIFIIGVSGVGKTTIARLLSDRMNLPYIDADDFHPPANIEKMKNGVSLKDEDRYDWLQNINQYIKENHATNGVIVACSALKENYRVQLSDNLNNVKWISLEGTFELIRDRMLARDHFMPSTLLESQFETWESPKYGTHINVKHKPEVIIATAYNYIINMKKAQIGLIGLGVMGKSLSRNIASRDISISVYNREVAGIEENVAANFVQEHKEMSQSGAYNDIEKFVSSLSTPRTVFLMVNAGQAVDAVIQTITPLLEPEDIIIDGGNSHYKDTERRYQELSEKNIRYIGTGVSGGEEGALKGPSIMPGGSIEAYEVAGSILQKIAAKDSMGSTCCAYIGKGGSGHFVKMVHNGIEYGEMQLIAEMYGVLRYHMGMSNLDIAQLFAEWNSTDSGSYLLEITSDILTKKENEDFLIDIILDRAGNKGTGSWTTIAACELGVAIPTLTAALFARYQSEPYDLRQKASESFPSGSIAVNIDAEKLRKVYQMARIINHHQGYALIAAASQEYQWNIDYKNLSRIWTNGCIIRSKYMERISEHIQENGNILLNDKLNGLINQNRDLLNQVVSEVSKSNISAPCLSSTLSYFNAYTQKQSLANIIQAQRDYFGAHTYERKDKERGEKFHTEWI